MIHFPHDLMNQKMAKKYSPYYSYDCLKAGIRMSRFLLFWVPQRILNPDTVGGFPQKSSRKLIAVKKVSRCCSPLHSKQQKVRVRRAPTYLLVALMSKYKSSPRPLEIFTLHLNSDPRWL